MALDYRIISVDSNGEMEVVINSILYRYFDSYEVLQEIYLDFYKALTPQRKNRVFKRIRSLKKYELITTRKEK